MRSVFPASLVRSPNTRKIAPRKNWAKSLGVVQFLALSMVQEIRSNSARMVCVQEIQAKYKITEKNVSAFTSSTTLLRGDIQMLQRTFKSNRTDVDVIAAWLDFILNTIKNIHKAVAKEDIFQKTGRKSQFQRQWILEAGP
jgi:hypothetical protein